MEPNKRARIEDVEINTASEKPKPGNDVDQLNSWDDVLTAGIILITASLSCPLARRRHVQRQSPLCDLSSSLAPVVLLCCHFASQGLEPLRLALAVAKALDISRGRFTCGMFSSYLDLVALGMKMTVKDFPGVNTS